MRVLIQPYSESWPSDFERAREGISRALGTSAKRIDHIGSTAVPDLAAKPIIDILLEVDDVESPVIQKDLGTIGLALVVDEPGHRMFRPSEGTVHLHLWRTGDPEIERHLLFRNWLRNQAKSSVIAEIVSRARENSESFTTS